MHVSVASAPAEVLAGWRCAPAGSAERKRNLKSKQSPTTTDQCQQAGENQRRGRGRRMGARMLARLFCFSLLESRVLLPLNADSS